MPGFCRLPRSGRIKATVGASRAAMNVVTLVSTTMALHGLVTFLAAGNLYLYWSLALFSWRYLRFVVNLAAFWCYSPSPRPSNPTYVPSRDVTVIIPTAGPERACFRETITSCAENKPAKIVIVTAGNELFAKTLRYVDELKRDYPLTRLVVEKTPVASKRHQIALAVAQIETDITVLLDDHVFWGPRYLESLLAPFEDSRVGLVGTHKRVRRADGLNTWGRFWNMLGATYLCRHNFDLRATNTVDGGVFVVSGRSCAMRTQILKHPEFLLGYTNEKFFFGMFGPLNPDDDNYNTRFAVRHGWKIKIQYTDDALMETTLGVEHPLGIKYLGQCQRWARTTWRSNLCSLITDRTVWASQPYCVYAVYLTSLTNFAAVTDPLLIYLFTHCPAYNTPLTLAGLVCWILFTKIVKVFDYFRRHPQDIPLFPAYLGFAYFHSLIKLWTLLTFWDCTWGGRQLENIKVRSALDAVPPSANPTASLRHDAINDHPNLAAIRSLRDRIGDLHAQQMQYVTGYQMPLLSELQHLRESLETLRGERSTTTESQGTALAELRQVIARLQAIQSSPYTVCRPPSNN